MTLADQGFKDFLLRGNIVDLAVAVVIGVAFTALITAFTESFLEPLIGLIDEGGIKGGTFTLNGQVFDWAAFINAVITFVLTAAVVYFAVVLPDEDDHGRRSTARRRVRPSPPRSSCWPRSVTCCGHSRVEAQAGPVGRRHHDLPGRL